MRKKKKKTCWKIYYSGFTVQALNICALSFYKCTFEMCGLWGWLNICVKIYRCHLLYARKYWFALLLWLLLLLLLLWHICISDVTSSLVWPQPGTIPQFGDNWFKNQRYFTIKQNETNILSSTIYLKTNKKLNATRIQILHRVYASHYLNQWCKNHCKAS